MQHADHIDTLFRLKNINYSEKTMSDELKPSETIDCVGLYCPQPLFQTRKAIDNLKSGEILEVLADDPGAESDLKSFARRTGHRIVLTERLSEGILRFLIEKG